MQGVMFKKANKPTQTTSAKNIKTRELIPTIITHDVHLLGNIVSDGAVDFSGTIDGNIRCDSLTLRENGTIKGEVTANSVFIQGTVKGLIRAKNVNLLASCKVEGIIIHEQLAIEDGAFVDGKFKRSDRVTSASNEDSETDDSGGQGYPALTRDVVNAVNVKMLENIRLIR
jgi:cytoskeletal protein CcmA (bactofilin family)